MKRRAAQDRNKIALEAIESILPELNGVGDDGSNQNSADSLLIIVEGRRDVVSLRNLGITTEIIPCSNQPVAEFCESIAEKKKTVIILTDWDRKGGILASRLEEQFKNLEVPCETAQREKLLFYSKREIKDVESLFSYVKKLKRITGTSVEDETERF
ncbi:MAG: toprim domain-containing protein [Methanosarcinales archaeon]|jgi:5S rRNA maturation endonuclease (ribonuclease M5)|nr:toprim domain-containing protein [Methanosarcinales archaeon]